MVVKVRKSTAKCVIKRKLKFENYKNSLEANQLENKIHDLETNEIGRDNFTKYQNEFIKNDKLILKTQSIFKSKGIASYFYQAN